MILVYWKAMAKALQALKDRDFPDIDTCGHRKAVCRRCGLGMYDCEPNSGAGEFWHLASPHQKRALRCVNDRKRFSTESLELVPFMRKGRRRFLARHGIRP